MKPLILSLLLLLAITCAVVGEDNVELTWKAPGDDEWEGQATEYKLYMSQEPIGADTLAWVVAADSLSFPCLVLGLTPDSKTLNLSSGTWYLMLIAADEVPNWSSSVCWGNVTTVVVPDRIAPACIVDLEAILR